jgi:hypothetical protein
VRSSGDGKEEDERRERSDCTPGASSLNLRSRLHGRHNPDSVASDECLVLIRAQEALALPDLTPAFHYPRNAAYGRIRVLTQPVSNLGAEQGHHTRR